LELVAQDITLVEHQLLYGTVAMVEQIQEEVAVALHQAMVEQAVQVAQV
jgi:hypothetical protein